MFYIEQPIYALVMILGLLFFNGIAFYLALAKTRSISKVKRFLKLLPIFLLFGAANFYLVKVGWSGFYGIGIASDAKVIELFYHWPRSPASVDSKEISGIKIEEIWKPGKGKQRKSNFSLIVETQNNEVSSSVRANSPDMIESAGKYISQRINKPLTRWSREGFDGSPKIVASFSK
ncbi:hypothetical protein HYY75_12910 [bacterium]|nr:hypothetical protein [bacterium]